VRTQKLLELPGQAERPASVTIPSA
jgi:hypothetical protein